MVGGEFHAIWGPDLFSAPASFASTRCMAGDDVNPKKSTWHPPPRTRETASQRMKQVVSQRRLVLPAQIPVRTTKEATWESGSQRSRSALSSSSPAEQPHQQHVPSLENLCVMHLANSIAYIEDGALDFVPCYLRQRIFEAVRNQNQQLLSGRALLTLCCGAQFTELNLRNANNVKDTDLEAISQSLPLLQSLDISHCSYVTDRGVSAMLKQCSSLTRLSCERVPHLTGEKSLRTNSAGVGLNNLVFLSLAGCLNVLDLAVRSVWRRANGLQDLDLSCCEKLSDETLFGMELSDLRRFSVGYCPRISDSGVSSVVKRCRAIESLELQGSNVTNQTLTNIALYLKGLKKLDLGFVEGVGDHGIHFVAKGCKYLENLILEQNQNITDDSMHSLANNSRALQHLDVSFCHLLNESSLLRVLGDCKLKSLHVTQCRRVSPQTRFWLVARLARADAKQELEGIEKLAREKAAMTMNDGMSLLQS